MTTYNYISCEEKNILNKKTNQKEKITNLQKKSQNLSYLKYFYTLALTTNRWKKYLWNRIPKQYYVVHYNYRFLKWIIYEGDYV